ncbi:MAG: hypothetical protein JWN78_2023 [Bacteroidota bacterium]|nr:hypothetical protein [Bacteroidota bacterium]
MKTKIILLSIFIALLIFSLGIMHLYPMLTKSVHGNEVLVLIDKTEEAQEELIQTKDITQLLDIDTHLWQKNIVRFNTITNLEYNKELTVQLPYTFILFSNPKKREKDITTFKSNIDNTLQLLYKEDSGRTRSSIYEPLVKSANKLAHSKAYKKIIVVQSDLNENKIFSVYRDSDFIQLEKEPQKVIERLEKQIQLEDGQGVEIYFIYQAKSDEEDSRFYMMSNLFKDIFERHHYTVHIASNIVI